MARRNTPKQLKKRRILLLCDGESEIAYFKLLKKKLKVNKSLIIHNKPLKNLESILHKLYRIKPAKGKRLEYEEIHLICDQEDISKKERHKSYEKFVVEIKKLNKEFKETDIKIISSFPDFEFWLLLHFPIKDSEYKKLYKSSDLKKILSKFHSKYQKGNEKWLENAIFNDIKTVKIAINRADKIQKSDNNCWTRVCDTVRQIFNNSI